MPSVAGPRAAAAVFVACIALVVAACGPATGTPTATVAAPTAAPTDQGSTAPSADAASPASVTPASPIAGVVVSIAVSGANQITGFTLKTNLGETYRFTIGQLQNADEFPPSNLKDSMDTSSPVLVFFDVVNGELVVNRMEDAG
jgi:hypothetical protein